MTRPAVLLLVAAASASGGCAALTNPVADGVPVRRLPAEVLGRSKSDLVPLPSTYLAQQPPIPYRLDVGDLLAVVAEGVPGFGGPLDVRPNDPPIPTQFPTAANPTAVTGFPVQITEAGTILLPRLDPIPVRGRSQAEVEQLIRDALVRQELIPRARRDEARVSVQVAQRRVYNVSVQREDTAPYSTQIQGTTFGGTRRGVGYTVPLPAGQNDVLRALNITGGPPGLDAKNEVVIERASPNGGPPRVTRIPLRVYRDQPLTIREEDVVLGEGDVLKIEARDTELYYTAGLLGAGEFPLPRDRDLDVIHAISQVRGPLLNGSFSQNQFIAQAVNSGIGNPNPTLCSVLRKFPDGRQLNIRVDINRAFRDPRERVLIQPGDTIVLQERPGEAIVRYFTQTFRFNTTAEVIESSSIRTILNASNP